MTFRYSIRPSWRRLKYRYRSKSNTKCFVQNFINLTKIISLPISCVATFSLGLKNLNLRQISQRLVFTDFNPPKFAAMTIRIRNPKTTALTFSSGNIVCTGSKNIDESLLACRKYTRLLQNAGIRVCFKDFCIQNIVASVAVGFPLKLHELAESNGPYVSYEASLFPGAVLRVSNPKMVFLLFRSGKIVITGKFCLFLFFLLLPN